MVNLGLAVRDSLILCLMALLGWRLFARLKVPAASLLGEIMTVGIARLLGIQFHHLPSLLRVLFQVVLGTFIGLRFSKNALSNLKRFALPVLIVSVWMLASCLSAGLIFQRLARVTPITAILGAAPGGLSEMTLLALSLDADVMAVASLQLARLLTIAFVIPFLAIRQAEAPSCNSKEESSEPKVSWQWSASITLLVGAVGGLIGYMLKLPAAGLLGALITVGLTYNLYRELPPLPEGLRVCAQVGIGGLVGANFGQETLTSLLFIAGPVVGTSIVVVGASLVLATLLRKLTDWDALTCLLAAAPGGVTQSSVLACELGADLLIVSLLQLSRLIAILVILPLLLRLPLWY